mmetsp:Transcript_44387/g.143200  ORF Transcript_44387/g.143200 Transcript_44387/m.143200 type:complete len:126 (-) Transcript_44387:30-407(-)
MRSSPGDQASPNLKRARTSWVMPGQSPRASASVSAATFRADPSSAGPSPALHPQQSSLTSPAMERLSLCGDRAAAPPLLLGGDCGGGGSGGGGRGSAASPVVGTLGWRRLQKPSGQLAAAVAAAQ